MTIRLESDGRIAMDIFNLTTALNRAISIANTAGLRVDVTIETVQECGVVWKQPIASVRVYRPITPQDDRRAATELTSEAEDPPHAA